MACEAWRQKIDAYADGELSQPEAAELNKHIRTCASCAADVLDRVQFKQAVAVAGRRFEPRADFRASLTKSIARPSRQRWSWPVVAIPALTVIILAMASVFHLQHQAAQRQHLYSELADLHVSTLASSTPVDVVSTDRHTVKPWFQGRIPFTFNLPDLQGTDFTLLGGRVTYLGQTPGAQLIYQLHKHEISVFIFPDGGASVPPGPANAATFHIESWAQGGLRYFVIGDTGASDLEALSKMIRGANS